MNVINVLSLMSPIWVLFQQKTDAPLVGDYEMGVKSMS